LQKQKLAHAVWKFQIFRNRINELSCCTPAKGLQLHLHDFVWSKPRAQQNGTNGINTNTSRTDYELSIGVGADEIDQLTQLVGI